MQTGEATWGQSRDWSLVSKSQGTLKVAGSSQKVGRDKEGSSPRPFRGSRANVLISYLMVSRTVKELTSVVLSYHICDN